MSPEQEGRTHLGLGLPVSLRLLCLPSTARIQSCTQWDRCGHHSSQPVGCCRAGEGRVHWGRGWPRVGSGVPLTHLFRALTTDSEEGQREVPAESL